MKSLKINILFFTVIIINLSTAQETNKIAKVKIGKFTYETYYKYLYLYEDNEHAYQLYYKRKGREQSICTGLYFSNTKILSISDINIDQQNLTITCVEKSLVKTVNQGSDSIKYVRKQNKKGFFDTVSVIAYKDGKGVELVKQ